MERMKFLIWLGLALSCLPMSTTAAVESAPVSSRPSPFEVQDEAEFFSLLDPDAPALAAVKQAVAVRDWPAAKQAWAKHLRDRSQPRWVWSHRDRAALQRICEEKFGGLARHTNAANQVLARDFDILGVRKKLDHDVTWLHGPIEWTHVLSRFGYWRDLGLAWWATGRSDYPDDFVFLLKDWIADNPVHAKPGTGRGTNGSVWRTLEAGIRADAWFEAMELFMDAPEFDAEAKYLMTRSLVEHARYLFAWSTRFRAGNWQVCETSGLATIGIMLPEFRESAGWRERGFQYLVEHMRRDVEPDGAHHELTPGYHTWVMNQFLKVSLLCRANGYDVPGLMDRHEKMFEFLMNLRQPDGTCVSVGDAGFGRRGSIDDSLGLGALIYQRPDLRYLGSREVAESWLWLFGPRVFEDYARLQPRAPAFASVLMPDTKYAVMRTGWGAADKFLFFDCAPWRGGHSHQDRLQVVVSAGRDLLVDPGVYSYDQPLSQSYFRKSEAHNVLLIDGNEQPASDPEVLAWHVGSEVEFVSGQIKTNGLRHQRSVLFVKPHYWVVVDHVFGVGEHEITRLFHFPLNSGARLEGRGVRTHFTSGMNLEVLPADAATFEMRKGWIPTGNATAAEAPVAALVTKVRLPATLGVVLTPFAGAQELPQSAQWVPGDPGLFRLQLKFPDGQRDDLAVAATPRQLGNRQQQAEVLALATRTGLRASRVAEVPAGISKPKLP